MLEWCIARLNTPLILKFLAHPHVNTIDYTDPCVLQGKEPQNREQNVNESKVGVSRPVTDAIGWNEIGLGWVDGILGRAIWHDLVMHNELHDLGSSLGLL